MRIEPFIPFNTLIKAVKVSPTYVEQGEITVTKDSLFQGLGLDSGVFTPTVSNETPNTTSITMNGGQYSRVNNIVTMNCWFEVSFGVSDASVQFNIDLPVPSNFTQTKQLMGIVTSNDVTNFLGGSLNADTVNDLGLITVSGVTGSTISYVYTMFQYEIV